MKYTNVKQSKIGQLTPIGCFDFVPFAILRFSSSA